MMSSTSHTTNGSAPQLPPWALMNVQQFFRTFNWDDHPPAVQDVQVSSSTGEATDLSLTLTVKQFFSAVNWEGAAIAAKPISVQPLTPSQPATGSAGLTLDDFSDLF